MKCVKMKKQKRLKQELVILKELLEVISEFDTLEGFLQNVSLMTDNDGNELRNYFNDTSCSKRK